MRVVVDTNVLISALLAPRSPPARILTMWRQGRFDLLTSDEEAQENAPLRFDINLLTKRLVTATMWVLRQPETDRMSIGYFGSSTGAAGASTSV